MTEVGPDWSKGGQLLVQTMINDTFFVVLDRLFDTSYTVNLYFSKGPGYGNLSISSKGGEKAYYSGYAPVLEAGGKITLQQVVPRNGKIVLELTVTGKDPLSAGYHVGFDGIELLPNRRFITEWKLLGPFPNPRTTETLRTGLDSLFIKEADPDTTATYTSIDGKQISWRYVQTPNHGYIALSNLMTPHELVVTYALTEVYSDEPKNVLLVFGSDDGAKIFLNGKQVYRYLGIRVAEPDQDTLAVRLNKGWNKLMFKIENNLGGYAFYARFIDPGNSLIYRAGNSEMKLP
jgi:hypothetical protein